MDSPQNSARARWLPALLSAALALALYSITLAGTYVYDDEAVIRNDPRLKSPRQWGRFWTESYNGGIDNLYRPLVSQSYAIEWWLHGNRPWVFHLINLLLHAAVCALVAELGRRLMSWRVGLFAGLLFAVHPIHVEAVANIVGRAELACAIGIVGGMVLFLGPPMTSRRALAIYLLCVVAMLSKEPGLFAPFLFAALLPFRRHAQQISASQPDVARQRAAERQPLMLLFALLLWTAGGIIVFREQYLKLKFEWERGFLDIALQPMIRSHGADRLLVPISLLGRYLALLLLPLRLSLDYGLEVIQPSVSRLDPYLWLGMFAAIAWVIAALLSLFRRQWAIAFCLIALAITYSMASNIILIATIFGERLMYLPSVFFLILLARLLVRLPARVGAALLMVLLILGSVRTFTYARQWNNRNAFYAYSLHQQPQSLQLHLLAAYAAGEEGRVPDALQILTDAKKLNPNYFQIWKMSATMYEKIGDWDDAIHDWKRAFDLAPNSAFEDALAHARKMRNQQRLATAPSTRR